jgi:hypothetical protein
MQYFIFFKVWLIHSAISFCQSISMSLSIYLSVYHSVHLAAELFAYLPVNLFIYRLFVPLFFNWHVCLF